MQRLDVGATIASVLERADSFEQARQKFLARDRMVSDTDYVLRRHAYPGGHARYSGCVHDKQQVIAGRRDVSIGRRFDLERSRAASGNVAVLRHVGLYVILSPELN